MVVERSRRLWPLMGRTRLSTSGQVEGRERLARDLFERARLLGRFTLRSGAETSEYFDKYLFESDPRLLRDVAEALAERLPPQVDALAGLELGGVPLATMISQVSGLPTRFVRRQPKPHGTCRLTEGGEVSGLRLVVVEDVVSSAGQALDSCRRLMREGAHVTTVVCVVDREAGGAENLAAAGLQLVPLFTTTELIAAAASIT